MSIRAYKIIKIETRKTPTFNVGEHFDWLHKISSYATFNNDGECRELEFNKDDIENALEDYKHEEDKVLILNGILDDFGENNDDYIAYSCH